MQKKKEPNLERRKSLDLADLAPTLSFLSLRKGDCGSEGAKGAGRFGELAFRAALGSPTTTTLGDFSVQLTSFLPFPHSVFRLVGLDLGFIPEGTLLRYALNRNCE